MQRQALAMLLGLAALQRSVVAPDLEMDTATSVPLDAGECLVFRVAVTPLHAAENRGLQVDYRSLDAAARPTAGYIAYGLATAHSSSAAAVDTSPAGLGVNATAGCWTSAAAVDLLKEAGARDIRFLCLLAAPEGVERMRTAHPDVHIVTASVDKRLNEKGYIVPGLGDAGDRMFGTK